MTFRIVYTTPASRDLDEIDDYLTTVAGPAIAERLVEEIIAAAQTLQNLPTRARRMEPTSNRDFPHAHG
ncbi:MAG: type II toxin-antitoxin system RelE/ParE family toxin [Xanthobacteraceae bacterium]